jgi:hypothetical protein
MKARPMASHFHALDYRVASEDAQRNKEMTQLNPQLQKKTFSKEERDAHHVHHKRPR